MEGSIDFEAGFQGSLAEHVITAVGYKTFVPLTHEGSLILEVEGYSTGDQETTTTYSVYSLETFWREMGSPAIMLFVTVQGIEIPGSVTFDLGIPDGSREAYDVEVEVYHVQRVDKGWIVIVDGQPIVLPTMQKIFHALVEIVDVRLVGGAVMTDLMAFICHDLDDCEVNVLMQPSTAVRYCEVDGSH
jgi:hypothetical protein